MTREEVARRIDRLWPCAADRVVRYFEHVFGIELDEPVKQWEGINGIDWRILSRPGEGLVMECSLTSGGVARWYQPEDELKVQELMRREILRLSEAEAPTVRVSDPDVMREMRAFAAQQRQPARAPCSCQFIPMAACSNCAEPEICRSEEIKLSHGLRANVVYASRAEPETFDGR